MNKHSTRSLTVRQVACVLLFGVPLFTYAAPGSFGGSTGGEMPGGSVNGGFQGNGPTVPTPFGGRSSPPPAATVMQAPSGPSMGSNARAVSGPAAGEMATPSGTAGYGSSNGQGYTGANSYGGATPMIMSPDDESPQVAQSRYQTFTRSVENSYQDGVRVITGHSAPPAATRTPERVVYVPVAVPTYVYVPVPDFTSDYSTPEYTVYTSTPAVSAITPISTAPAFGSNPSSIFGLSSDLVTSPVQNPQWIFTPWNPAEDHVADYTNRITVEEPVASAPAEGHVNIIHIIH